MQPFRRQNGRPTSWRWTTFLGRSTVRDSRDGPTQRGNSQSSGWSSLNQVTRISGLLIVLPHADVPITAKALPSSSWSTLAVQSRRPEMTSAPDAVQVTDRAVCPDRFVIDHCCRMRWSTVHGRDMGLSLAELATHPLAGVDGQTPVVPAPRDTKSH